MTIKPIDESNLEDEVRLCIPSPEHPRYSRLEFENGVKDKVNWLRQRLNDYGYVGHIAYSSDGRPRGFIEFISAKNAPLPVEEPETTAVITCIDLPETAHRQGTGTILVKAALRQLWKIGVRRAKTLVSRSPKWINDGIYRKSGFQLEKTFYREGSTEPFDLLTLRVNGPQTKVKPVTEHLQPPLKNTLPIEIVYFHSAQCPFSSPVYMSLKKALAKFGKAKVELKTIDCWENPEAAKRYGSMHFFDTFINGRAPFFGPPTQGEIEGEIQKEINRVLKAEQ